MAAGLGAVLPFVYVYRKWRARQERIVQQLPDAFDLMSRIIRAGQTMWQAIQAVADEFDQPLGGEFTYCYEQQNLGISPDVALRDLARRTGILEVKIFVLAMLVQQQSGGNLAEVLDNMATVLRSRFHVRRKISALTAEGRLQAIILLVLPVLLLFIMMLASVRYEEAISQYPNLIVAMGVSEAIGAWWIRKIVNFDF
jgi:tight adherence protein B